MVPVLAFYIGKTDIWLTPPWLIATGVTLAALALAVAWGIVRLAARPMALRIAEAMREGVLAWVTWTTVALAGYAVIMVVFSFAEIFAVPWQGLLDSAARLPFVRSGSQTQTVAAQSKDIAVELPVPLGELYDLKIETDRDVALSLRGDTEKDAQPYLPLLAKSPLTLTRLSTANRLFFPGVKELLVSNTSDQPVTLTITAASGVRYPEAETILVSAAATLIVVLSLLVFRAGFPTVWAISYATGKEITSQWLFWLMLVVGLIFLWPFVLPFPSLMYIPFNTFGEDIKMLKDNGLTLMLMFSLVVGLTSAGVSISEEIEGRTTLTLLSKPVSRRQFIFGKFLGVVWPVAAMFLVLGLVFLVTISCKVVYDGRENLAASDLTWQLCHGEMVRTVPGMVLKFMEAVILMAICVALSTRLPLLANLVVTVSIYAVGHLVPLIVESGIGQFPAVGFISQLLGTILPVLDHFYIPGAIVGENDVPASYLWWAGGYSLLYVAFAMLFALAMFEDRDLA